MAEMSNEIAQHHDYKSWAEFITAKIKSAQTQAAFKVNSEMLTLCWEIGSSILEKQNQNGWGSKVIDLLAGDLAKRFPDNSGFSVRNLKYMRAFAQAYSQFPIVQVPLAQGVASYELERLVKENMDKLDKPDEEEEQE